MTSKTKDGEFDLAEFYTQNKKAITYGAGALAVVIFGGWFWSASSARKAVRAEEAYAAAERSVYSGNPQLAQTDLQRLVQRYGNTPAGVRGSILLAKHHFQQAKPAEAIPVLRDAAGQGAAGPFKSAVYALLGAAYESQQQFDSAATAFKSAADAADAVSEKEIQQASAARALTAAGKKEDALTIWRAIAARETSPLAGEAKLRIAELSATPAKG